MAARLLSMSERNREIRNGSFNLFIQQLQLASWDHRERDEAGFPAFALESKATQASSETLGGMEPDICLQITLLWKVRPPSML